MATPTPPRLKPRGSERRDSARSADVQARRCGTAWSSCCCSCSCRLYYITPAGRSIPYSEFKALVKNGGVEEVTVGDQLIRGTLKQPAPDDPKQSKQFTTTRVDDPKLTEELEATGVKYSGEVVNRWLPELLGWIIPLIFFVAIWGFFFRRMSGAEGGVMSFARSRAKAYADDEVKVRFTDVAGVDEAEDELQGDRRVPEDARRSTRTSAAAFPRACCSSALREPARRCWRAPSPAKRTCRSSA